LSKQKTKKRDLKRKKARKNKVKKSLSVWTKKFLASTAKEEKGSHRKNINQKLPNTPKKKQEAKKPNQNKNKNKKSSSLVDEILLRLSPSAQTRIDQLAKAVEAGSLSLGEFKTLGVKILQKAIAISSSLNKKHTN
jgi:hypothetical protein